MRLAVCTLSAVLMSGCSWFGYGGGGSSYGTNCAAASYGGQYAYGSQYSQAAYGAGCGVGYGAGGGYGIGSSGGGYGMNGGYGAGYGAGANGYGVGTGALGLRGAQGAGAYGGGMGGAGMSGYGMNGVTAYGTGIGAGGAYGTAGGGQFVNGQWVAGTAGGAGTVLNGAAPYGTAVGGQYINGQWVAGGTQVAGGYGYGTSGSVTTVQGAPIYVPQPYPAYYGVGYAAGGGYAYGGGLRGGYAALPFGIEAGIGTDINVGGDIIGTKPENWADGDPATGLYVSSTPAIAYKDAFDNPVSYNLAATYDVDPSTTLLAQVGYSNSEGQRMKVGTLDNRTVAADPTTATISEDLYAEFSDLEQVSLEGGVRKYMGGWNNRMSGIRPYVQATAGFTHNSAVTLAQESGDGSATALMPSGSNVQQYIDAGWTPTASGAVGAEMQVGPRTAIGVETGIRWQDDLNSNFPSDDRWSVPVKLRGRVSF